mmetsp:Transcript_26673/g.61365  ORF Transcript_26673/g.61365 Transcript_26673/m.61365 type:complete len:965 (-) Transcript_26673:60-2954(-)
MITAVWRASGSRSSSCAVFLPLLLHALRLTNSEEVADLTWRAKLHRAHGRSLSVSGMPPSGYQPSTVLPEIVELHMASQGIDYHVNLTRHRVLLPGHFQHILHFKNGSVASGPLPTACLYLGKAVISAASNSFGSASVSACAGKVSGVIVTLDRALAFEVASADGNISHVLKGICRLRDIKDQDIRVRHRDIANFMGGQNRAYNTTAEGRHLTSSSLPTKYVEVLAINDYARFQAFGGQPGLQELAQHTAEVFLRVNALYHVPIQGGSFSYNVQVVLVAQHTFLEADPWDASVRMSGIETDFQSLLNAMHAWGFRQASALQVAGHDNRVLLSGRNFVGSVVGLAGLSTMCMGSQSGSVTMCGAGESRLDWCGAVVAHEMGHNFGMNHDSDGNSCPGGSIMGAGDPDTTKEFSSCSAAYLNNFFESTYTRNGQCLENYPATVLGEPLCRNGFVECGDGEDCVEQCDCGSEDCSSIDPCCNGQTCRFADAGHQCSDVLGNCCQSCRFVGGIACRPAKNDCDLPERCTGTSGVCPADLYVYPGRSCSTSGFDGKCFSGNCMSQDALCAIDLTRDFWGRFDITEACAAYNDDCQTMVCHDASSSDPLKCVQTFALHGRIMTVPDGTPCWFESDVRGERNGMCYGGQCVPAQVLAEVPLCGNGGIDFGEECDCGPDGTNDPCCDCTTCQLSSGSRCSALEPCCSACQFAAAGTTCRASLGDCDEEEACTGSSGVCPPDIGKRWGTVCTDSDGVNSTCYGKVCLDSLDKQCAAKVPGRPKAQSDVHGNRSQGAGHDCNGLMCCSTCTQHRGSLFIGGIGLVTDPYTCSVCSRSTQLLEWTYNSEQVEMWLTGALDGSVLNDPTKMCILFEEVTPPDASTCGATEFFDHASARCLPCHPGCETCSGPRNSDCIGRCKYAQDSRGACASLEQQQYAGQTSWTETTIGHASRKATLAEVIVFVSIMCTKSIAF